MAKLLAIELSPRFDRSTPRKLTGVFIEQWEAANPTGSVIVRDLVKTNLPFLDLPWIGRAFTPRETHSPESMAAIKVSDDLVAELKSADRIVIGTPIYNFGIPALLKAYIVRIGVTFEGGNQIFATTGNAAYVGLLKGKSADIILASGGGHSPGSPTERHDQASVHLRQILFWIGIADVNILVAPRALAGFNGETAVERFGDAVRAAAVRQLAATAMAPA